MSSTNVSAGAVNTVEWLSSPGTTIAVPVYQRRYRWEIGGCKQLLTDVRAVAGKPAGLTHFVGSILYTTTSDGQVTERMLVDGQQRVATLTVLIAALRDTLRNSDPGVAGRLDQLLLHPARQNETRLRLRREGALELDSIVFGRSFPDVGVEVSHLRENYDFFRDEIRDDAPTVWNGLQRLEHVAITLQEHANPQQVFESLNSTGAPLKNHELIHNHILMGLDYRQQAEIEDSFWIPIEANTGDAIDDFLRDYLILKTGRDSDFGADRGVYQAFKRQFPTLAFRPLRDACTEWKAYSGVYRTLLEPNWCDDVDIRQQLHNANTFGTAMYPLLLGVYSDYTDDENKSVEKNTLLEVLEQLQSLYLRKMVVGESRDHLAAQLCRKRRQYDYPIHAIVQKTPEDERVREALRHRPLPHAGYVLRRIQDPGHLADLEIEHIFPQFPASTWTGDGDRQWHTFSEEERAKYREVLSTIGNLTLLEQPLNAAASNRPFLDKRVPYEQSGVQPTRDLAAEPAWDLTTISRRTAQLTDQFLSIWNRPNAYHLDDPEQLVPILDVPKKPGHYLGWATEFEYAVFQNEVWDVHNLKTLFRRLFRRLWADHRDRVLAYSARHEQSEYSDAGRGPIYEKQEWRSQWDALPGSHYLFMGLFPQHMLGAIQAVLDQLNMADELSVKYSTEE